MKKIYSLIALLLIGTTTLNAQTYSFTTATATGTVGPNQGQVDAAYAGTDLDGMVTITGSGIQNWTVPSTGTYTLTAAGASGGYTPNALGGQGREITVEVDLTIGDVIQVLVGQEGGRADFASPGWCGGGGGGTFIYNLTTGNPILICGGGGGAGEANASYGSPMLNGVDASPYNVTSGGDGTGFSQSWSTPGVGGVAGAGGTTYDGGSAGSGYSGNGQQGTYGGLVGTNFLTGGLGGINMDYYGGVITNIPGGFGGGAGAGTHSNYEANGGGAGGYSGGGGSNSRAGAGGGGGNFYTGIYVSDGLNTGHGFATITPTCDAVISSVSATDVCDGEYVTLSVTSAGTGVITWDNGVVDNVAFQPPLGTTSYTATSSDINECEFSVDITVNAMPTVDGGVDIILCEGVVDTMLVASGMADTFTWDNGITDGVLFTPTIGSTTYVVTAEYTASGCQITDTVLVMAGSPSISLSSVDEMFGNDGSASLNILSGVPPFTFDWDNDGVGDNDDSNDLFNVPAGTYTVIMTDASGCTTSETIVIGSQVGLDELNLELNVYPNPTDGKVIAHLAGAFDYQVFDALGQVLIVGNSIDHAIIDLSTVATGTYSIRFTTTESTVIARIIKE